MADSSLAAPQGCIVVRQQMILDAVADLVDCLQIIYEESGLHASDAFLEIVVQCLLGAEQVREILEQNPNARLADECSEIMVRLHKVVDEVEDDAMAKVYHQALIPARNLALLMFAWALPDDELCMKGTPPS